MRLPLCLLILVSFVAVPARALVTPASASLDQKVRLPAYVLDETIDSSDPAAALDALNRVRSKRGIIHANRRFTPCIRDPAHPRWSHT